MKKLDDIPKKNIFEVPEGYFDQLPMKIQARLEKPEKIQSVSIWSLSLRYALPVIVVGFALVYFLKPQLSGTEELLANISDEHLMAYLDESDMSENDLLEVANFDESDADSLNQDLSTPWLGDIDEKEYKSVLENEL